MSPVGGGRRKFIGIYWVYVIWETHVEKNHSWAPFLTFRSYNLGVQEEFYPFGYKTHLLK